MSPISLLLALTFAASAVKIGNVPTERPAPRRPVVLVVHGRGFLARDSADFHRDALHALREGAFRATGDSLLETDDIRLVWYADLMDVRRAVQGSVTSCETNTNNVDVGISPNFIFRSLALVASELVQATAADSVADGARDIAGDLRFIGDPALRCAAEGRVADAIARAHADGRPVVIVAHSLGALVTWSHLQHRGARTAGDVPEVERLVTMGSPIGNSNLRELLLGDMGEVALPRGVRSWVNAVNADDAFAARLVEIDSLSGRTRALRGITDVVTGHAEEAHDLFGYLRDSTTATAVAGAWCDAAEHRGRISACVALSKK
jgi:pimeloyl-ACP methyl ester carboxylesterase